MKYALIVVLMLTFLNCFSQILPDSVFNIKQDKLIQSLEKSHKHYFSKISFTEPSMSDNIVKVTYDSIELSFYHKEVVQFKYLSRIHLYSFADRFLDLDSTTRLESIIQLGIVLIYYKDFVINVSREYVGSSFIEATYSRAACHL